MRVGENVWKESESEDFLAFVNLSKYKFYPPLACLVHRILLLSHHSSHSAISPISHSLAFLLCSSWPSSYLRRQNKRLKSCDGEAGGSGHSATRQLYIRSIRRPPNREEALAPSNLLLISEKWKLDSANDPVPVLFRSKQHNKTC